MRHNSVVLFVNMVLKEFYQSLIVFVLLTFIRVECTHNKTGNYSIGFEGFHRVGPNNYTSSGRENVHSRYYTTPPVRRQSVTTMKPSRPKNTKVPVVYITTVSPSIVKATKLPSIRATTFKPSSTRRPSSTKPSKPKATHPTTKKPTVPTLPPSIYVKPNISKVILPPLIPPMEHPTYLPPNLVIPTTITPKTNPTNFNFNTFYNYLQNFVSKAEHTKQPIHQPNKGDTYTYYYDISHYYKNAHKASSYYKVYVNNIKNCATNTSKIMCLPNTNALCLTNGTIMCVTHLSATISCQNGSKYCAITYLPCDAKYQSCATNDKFYVGIPCVSKVLLLPSSNDFYQSITLSPIEYCITSVIQPQRLYSVVGSLFSFLVSSAKKQYESLNDNVFRYNNVMY
ncbi:hypothetical protein RI129_007289 [Pyrocoelia pectoralis]|uniref:Uncharacterized protein n=1 Tax=Pyrocoelia pectoralis TaxID=417401 RepID=A0AAN7VHL7_9COLE